jgi:hypothetical protein
MSRNGASYRSIGTFGPGVSTAPLTSPLSYCLMDSIDTSFNHGQDITINGPQSKKCQMFMSDHCAEKWDGACEYAFNNRNKQLPNMLQSCDADDESCINGLTEGQLLLKNTAMKKYLIAMSDNCQIKYEPFDPLTYSSPMVTYWDSGSQCRGSCIPIYGVDPSNIDDDRVMNLILRDPKIAINILLNIYNTAVRQKTINNLKGTKIYAFFMTQGFQNYSKLSASRANYIS